jgi:hypothetical protein
MPSTLGSARRYLGTIVALAMGHSEGKVRPQSYRARKGMLRKGGEAWLLLPETQPRPTHPGLEIFPDPDGKYLTLGLP